MQKDRILNQLSVLAEAAKSIDAGDAAGSGPTEENSPVFGHLHIVFRDWNFTESDGEEIKRDLFALECADTGVTTPRKGRSREAVLRGHARTAIPDAFQSVKVWYVRFCACLCIVSVNIWYVLLCPASL